MCCACFNRCSHFCTSDSLQNYISAPLRNFSFKELLENRTLRVADDPGKLPAIVVSWSMLASCLNSDTDGNVVHLRALLACSV